MNFRKPLTEGWRTYIPAASDKRIRKVLLRTAEEAIAFRHVFPPRHDAAPTTFFGGLPRVPDGFEWPCGLVPGNAPGTPPARPPTFLGQVDCAELPKTGLRDFLPGDGALLFFVRWELLEGDEGGVAVGDLVHHVPGSPREWREAPPPAGLPPCYGENAEYQHEWLEHTDRSARGYPMAFPRWAMEPRAVRTYAEEHPTRADGNSAGRYQELWNEEQTRALQEVHGEPVEESRLLSSHDRGYDRVWRPFAAFPHAWLAVEMVAGILLHPLHGIPSEARQERRRDAGSWPADAQALTRSYRAARAEAERWVEKARRAGLYAGVPDEGKAAFWAWLDRLHESVGTTATDRIYDRRSAYTLNKCLDAAAARSVDDCLAHSAAAAALVPDEAREAVRHRHAVLVRGTAPRNAGRHQMLGAGRNVQGAPERFRDSHVLLMQFDTDAALNWTFGDCGVLQYWITPDDLAARRFDRTQVTLEGH